MYEFHSYLTYPNQFKSICDFECVFHLKQPFHCSFNSRFSAFSFFDSNNGATLIVSNRVDPQGIPCFLSANDSIALFISFHQNGDSFRQKIFCMLRRFGIFDPFVILLNDALLYQHLKEIRLARISILYVMSLRKYIISVSVISNSQTLYAMCSLLE